MTPIAAAGRTLDVALHAGVWFHHDAISRSLSRKLAIIDELADAGWPITATVFTHASDYDEPRVRVCGSPSDLLAHVEFHSANVHIFEFGIHYPNFNSVFMLPRSVTTVGVYHNVTPPDLVDDPGTRDACVRSQVQKANLFEMTEIVCDSEYNRDDLLAFGIEAERIRVAHLPPTVFVESPVPLGRRGTPGRVRLLFVGRLVPAKGVRQLLEAFEELVATRADVDLVLAGDTRFSPPDFVDWLDGRLAGSALSGRVRLNRSPSDEELREEYAEADVFVIPSHHEGYCIPVVEALRSGLFVVASDAANLPHVVGDCGVTVPAGYSGPLRDALARVCDEIRAVKSGETRPATLTVGHAKLSETEWSERVVRHLARYSEERYREQTVALLRRCAKTHGMGGGGASAPDLHLGDDAALPPGW
jgi:glycosyltransferase involved in cell wall biosynthesis